jgi:branched-chain amino acid transport system permease protein
MSTIDSLPEKLLHNRVSNYFGDRLTRATDTPRNAAILVGAIVIALLMTVLGIEPLFHLGVTICIFGSVAVGLDLLGGYTGQVSVAHAGFMGIGAYTSAILTMDFGMPLVVGFLAACLLPMVVGIAIGVPAFRAEGHYFVLATLALAVLFTTVFQVWDPVTGGPRGITGIFEPAMALYVYGIRIIDVTTTRGYFFLTLAYLVAMLVLVNNVLNSRLGRAFIAVRENEALAKSHGINTRVAKLASLGISCFIAGGAGSLYAHYFSFINPEVFGFFVGFEALVMVIVGGLGSLIGAVVGAIFIKAVPELLRDYPRASELVFGITVLIVVLYLPTGIWGSIKTAIKRLRS